MHSLLENNADQNDWFCRSCSFRNSEFFTQCEMCASPRTNTIAVELGGDDNDNDEDSADDSSTTSFCSWAKGLLDGWIPTARLKRSYEEMNGDDVNELQQHKRFKSDAREELRTDVMATCWLNEEDDVKMNDRVRGSIFHQKMVTDVRPAAAARESVFQDLIQHESRDLVVYGYHKQQHEYLSSRVRSLAHGATDLTNLYEFQDTLRAAFAVIFYEQPTFEFVWETQFAMAIDRFVRRGGVVAIRGNIRLPRKIRDVCAQGKKLDVARFVPSFEDEAKAFEVRMMARGGAYICCSTRLWWSRREDVLDFVMIYGALVPLAAVVRWWRDRGEDLPQDILTALFEAAFGASKVESGAIWDRNWEYANLFNEIADSF